MPIPTEFGFHTTSDEVAKHFAPQIEGKTILITGVSPNGLGAETAAAIALQKPKLLILAGRSPDKIRQTQEAIAELAPDVEIKTLIVDLSSLKQARQAGEEVESWCIAIDVLINNAGIMAIPERELTEDGYEAHFATNHLGPFVFTTAILPSLRRASSPRIVNVSSWGHHMSPVLFEDLNAEKSYEKFARYGHSKTANILFAVAFTRRGLCAVSLHPGVVRTALLRHLTHEDAVVIGFIKEDYSVSDGFRFKSLKEGAATHIVAAFEPTLQGKSACHGEVTIGLTESAYAESGGVYLDNCQIQSNVEAYAVDPENAERLWQVSEELVAKALA
ncbi:WW domain-containing oxidoreductase [Rhodotorula sp. JG-1b]|nr:WW domain-containing oxidoreductase [Rhodotorula sp. JG-1b]